MTKAKETLVAPDSLQKVSKEHIKDFYHNKATPEQKAWMLKRAAEIDAENKNEDGTLNGHKSFAIYRSEFVKKCMPELDKVAEKKEKNNSLLSMFD